MTCDIAIVGAGPAGATCAAFCAQAGLRTLLLEKSTFPREKVCGDCLNPGCWPVLERLGVADRVLAAPRSLLGAVEFIGRDGAPLRVPLVASARGEIAIKRSLLDALLLDRVRECGVHVVEGAALTALQPGWQLTSSRGNFFAPRLVAADGRNSTVARLLGLHPAARKDRVALQAHLPAPAHFGDRVALHFLPWGYCGVASVGGAEINVCLVSRPSHLSQLREWAASRLGAARDEKWRTITPLRRAPLPPARENLLLVGDVARIVEPFTGEGIFYALRTGELAARHLISGDLPGYAAAHAQLYRGRLWLNELARAAVLHPWLAERVLQIARFTPGALRLLTKKVVGPAA